MPRHRYNCGTRATPLKVYPGSGARRVSEMAKSHRKKRGFSQTWVSPAGAGGVPVRLQYARPQNSNSQVDECAPAAPHWSKSLSTWKSERSGGRLQTIQEQGAKPRKHDHVSGAGPCIFESMPSAMHNASTKDSCATDEEGRRQCEHLHGNGRKT